MSCGQVTDHVTDVKIKEVKQWTCDRIIVFLRLAICTSSINVICNISITFYQYIYIFFFKSNYFQMHIFWGISFQILFYTPEIFQNIGLADGQIQYAVQGMNLSLVAGTILSVSFVFYIFYNDGTFAN